MISDNQTHAPVEKESEGWHVDKRVSVSHLLATATLAAGLVQWGTAIDSRVALLETRLQAESVAQAKTDESQDRQREAAVQAVASRLDRIEDKLDRLIEGGYSREQAPGR